ncbi:MAG: 4Fe-4S binding protein [Proteobacteria bacterium]|nr:4Fe-4S binding protein [Pseudomonadota bacterium]
MDDAIYFQVAEAFDRNPFGVPRTGGRISTAFIEFLKLIYTRPEAEIVRHLQVYPFFKTADQAANAAGRPIDEVTAILAGLHARYALMGLPDQDQHALPTIFYLFNFHHRTPEVGPHDIEAARLYQEFFIDEGFYRLFQNSRKGTPVFRAIPVEQSIEAGQTVLSPEEIHDRIEGLQTDYIALVPCPCRVRTEKLGQRECRDRFPIGACMIPGDNGRKFVDLGYGRRATREQALRYADEMMDPGLVASSENALTPDPIVICFCCECCCSHLRGRTRWDNPGAISPSNFFPRAGDDCLMCGACVERCPVGALSLDDEAGRPAPARTNAWAAAYAPWPVPRGP